MFHITYQILDSKSYRAIIEPKGYIFLYNASINCKTIDLPTTVH